MTTPSEPHVPRELGNTKGAVEDLRKVLQFEPKNAPATQLLRELTAPPPSALPEKQAAVPHGQPGAPVAPPVAPAAASTSAPSKKDVSFALRLEKKPGRRLAVRGAIACLRASALIGGRG